MSPQRFRSKIALTQILNLEQHNLTKEQQIQIVLAALAEVQSCRDCGARFRFGDLDCPHCGAELDDYFRRWAESLLQKLEVG